MSAVTALQKEDVLTAVVAQFGDGQRLSRRHHAVRVAAMGWGYPVRKISHSSRPAQALYRSGRDKVIAAFLLQYVKYASISS